MSPENIKILLVDDFKSTRNLERSMLNAVGYTNVVDAEDGDDAIAQLKKEGDIDLIVSDWNMPNRNGYELLVWVRANEDFKHIPFIMATAQSEKKEMIKALKAGATNYIPKPFSKEELKTLIDKTMANKAKTDTLDGSKPKAPVKSDKGKVIINAAHIQITDHLALGAMAHLISTEEFKPKYFELKTHCMSGWNPVSQALENGEVDVAFLLAPIAMDLFKYDVPIRMILFAHRNGSICVGNSADQRLLHSSNAVKEFFLGKTFYIPHLLSIHHMLSDMFLKSLGLNPGVSGNENVNVFFEIVPPVQMAQFMAKDERVGGFLVAEPIGTNAIANQVAKSMFVSSEIWNDHPCCVVAMRNDIIEQHPDAVHEFTQMLVQAGMYISNNVDKAAEIGVNFLDPEKKLGLRQAVMKKVLMDPRGIKTDNLFPVMEDLDQIQRYMYNVMNIGSTIDLEKFVITKFADEACKNALVHKKSSMREMKDVVANIVQLYSEKDRPNIFDPEAVKKELSDHYFQNGVQLLKSKKTFEALESLFAAFALDHTNMKAVNNIVVAYKHLGSQDFAMKMVDHVLAIDPDNYRAKEHKKALMAHAG